MTNKQSTVVVYEDEKRNNFVYIYKEKLSYFNEIERVYIILRSFG